jgi:hypothetical protein
LHDVDLTTTECDLAEVRAEDFVRVLALGGYFSGKWAYAVLNASLY